MKKKVSIILMFLINVYLVSIISPHEVEASTRFELKGKNPSICSCDKSTQKDSIVRNPSNIINLLFALLDQNIALKLFIAQNDWEICVKTDSLFDLILNHFLYNS